MTCLCPYRALVTSFALVVVACGGRASAPVGEAQRDGSAGGGASSDGSHPIAAAGQGGASGAGGAVGASGAPIAGEPCTGDWFVLVAGARFSCCANHVCAGWCGDDDNCACPDVACGEGTLCCTDAEHYRFCDNARTCEVVASLGGLGRCDGAACNGWCHVAEDEVETCICYGVVGGCVLPDLCAFDDATGCVPYDSDGID